MPKIADIQETPNPNAVKFILKEPVSVTELRIRLIRLKKPKMTNLPNRFSKSAMSFPFFIWIK